MTKSSIHHLRHPGHQARVSASPQAHAQQPAPCPAGFPALQPRWVRAHLAPAPPGTRRLTGSREQPGSKGLQIHEFLKSSRCHYNDPPPPPTTPPTPGPQTLKNPMGQQGGWLAGSGEETGLLSLLLASQEAWHNPPLLVTPLTTSAWPGTRKFPVVECILPST